MCIRFLNYRLLAFWLLISISTIRAQKKPVARFTFNDKSAVDDVSDLQARLVGISHTDDRFGNANNAVYLFGHEHSYVNLGTSGRLKPSAGTISLWFKIDAIVYSGVGSEVNPILLTKCADRDDFYEAYAMYYFYPTRNVNAAASMDSTRQCSIYNPAFFKRYVWHHLVYSYDSALSAFYIDGKPIGKAVKPFEIKFNPLDSVLLGSTGNKKNNRFTNGAFDDVAFYDYMLSDDEVLALYHAPNPNKFAVLLNWLLISLGVICFIYLLYQLVRYRFRLTLKKEKEKLELANTMLSNELRVNRALMNPHFMFNSLNTLHHYILTNNVDKGSRYLVKFSKLIRKILDSNMHDFISLEQEIELIDRYLEIESMRFKEVIHQSITIGPDVVPSAIIIPIMMLQPFVENAIWHGLREKQGEKTVRITFILHGDNYLQCIIEDNGTGRKKGSGGSAEKKSLATNFVLQRLSLINKIHDLECSLSITDKPNAQGTIVSIVLPILNKLKHEPVKSSYN